MRHGWNLCLLGLLAACGDSAASEAADDPVLVFTAIPDQDETMLREKYAPVAAYLSDKLGVPVEYLHSTSYDDSVEHFKNGDVQLAWFGGLSGVKARHAVEGARAVAQGEADTHFYSYFIANKRTGLSRSDNFPLGLEGKTFTFGSAGSTSGRLMPEHFIRQQTGKSPEEFFGVPNSYADSHDDTVKRVEQVSYDAGVVNYSVYERRVRDGETDPDVCRVIWQTPEYLDYNFTAHPVLEERFGVGFTDKLQKVLIEMDDPTLLSVFPRKRLIKASNEDYAEIKDLALQLGFIRS